MLKPNSSPKALTMVQCFPLLIQFSFSLSASKILFYSKNSIFVTVFSSPRSINAFGNYTVFQSIMFLQSCKVAKMFISSSFLFHEDRSLGFVPFSSF